MSEEKGSSLGGKGKLGRTAGLGLGCSQTGQGSKGFGGYNRGRKGSLTESLLYLELSLEQGREPMFMQATKNSFSGLKMPERQCVTWV